MRKQNYSSSGTGSSSEAYKRILGPSFILRANGRETSSPPYGPCLVVGAVECRQWSWNYSLNRMRGCLCFRNQSGHHGGGWIGAGETREETDVSDPGEIIMTTRLLRSCWGYHERWVIQERRRELMELTASGVRRRETKADLLPR